jgi:protein TonB
MSVATLHHGYDTSGTYRVFETHWKSWFPVVVLVALSHAGVWLAYTAWQNRAVTQPLPAVQISLISLPAPQEAKPTPQLQRTPVPAKPQPAPAEKPEIADTVTEETVAAAASTESAPAEAQPEYSQPLYNAAYLNNPPPVYPLAARRRGIEGTVMVRAQIQEDGHCLQADLSKSSGHEMLDKAAVAAVRSWRFVPAKRGTQTIVAWVEVPITFRLTQQDKQT